jgi:hypothetical protein
VNELLTRHQSDCDGDCTATQAMAWATASGLQNTRPEPGAAQAGTSLCPTFFQ